MPVVRSVLRELVEYALSKKGMRQNYPDGFAKHGLIELELPGPQWPTVMEERDGSLGLAALEDRIANHQSQSSVIKQAQWAPRDGHALMEIPFDADLPLEFLKMVIDDAYEIIWQKLDERQVSNIELALKPYNEQARLTRKLELSPLAERHDEVMSLLKPALLLRTRESTDAKIPVGDSKVGGQPDLPPEVTWPTDPDGKPLAFLAQLNLAEVARHPISLKGLPASGLLSVFSVRARCGEDGDGPDLPSGDWDEQGGWNAILHHKDITSLERRAAPDDIRTFAAAAIEMIPISSTPNHRKEPNVAALEWDTDDYDALWDWNWDVRGMQLWQWLQRGGADTSHHLLGGYAVFQQEFPEELQSGDRVMLLQIGSDENIGGMWGDGGELTFYVDAAALAAGRFERILSFEQGG